jgi:hypothetical protein
MSWHAQDSQLERYLSGELDDVGAWSLEAHLDTCAGCRDRLVPMSAESPVGLIVTAVRPRIQLEAQDRVRLRGRARQVRMLAGPAWRVSWLLGTAVLLLLAVVLDGSAHGASRPALLAIAPALPLLGVAMSFGRLVDPAFEMTAATASTGLRLVLWRTAGVLALTVPLAAIAGIAGGGEPVLWLLPCLGLTVGSLALGTFLPVTRAAALLGSVWALASGVPACTGLDTSVAVTGTAALAWSIGTLIAVLLLYVRRGTYTRMELS